MQIEPVAMYVNDTQQGTAGLMGPETFHQRSGDNMPCVYDIVPTGALIHTYL